MYVVLTCSNGNYNIVAEGLTKESAMVNYHNTCAAFWNAPDVLVGQVAIINEQLQIVDGHTEEIVHRVDPEENPQPTPEPEEQGE